MKLKEISCHIIHAPSKPSHLPVEIQWLSGEGCGSWFYIEEYNFSTYLISRFSPEGKIECRGIFKQISGNPIDLKSKFDFTYLSHCAEVNIIQKSSNLKFQLIQKPM